MATDAILQIITILQAAEERRVVEQISSIYLLSGVTNLASLLRGPSNLISL